MKIIVIILSLFISTLAFAKTNPLLPDEEQDPQDIFDYFNVGHNLSEEEKAFFLKHPLAMKWFDEAQNVTREYSKGLCAGGGTDDQGDALRHYIQSCYVSFHLRIRDAREILLIHEKRFSRACKGRPEEKCFNVDNRMDMYNNELGLKCGDFLKKHYPNDSLASSPKLKQALKDIVAHAYKSGQLAVLEDRKVQTAEIGTKGRQKDATYNSPTTTKVDPNSVATGPNGPSKECELATTHYPNKLHEKVPEKVSEYNPEALFQPQPELPPEDPFQGLKIK